MQKPHNVCVTRPSDHTLPIKLISRSFSSICEHVQRDQISDVSPATQWAVEPKGYYLALFMSKLSIVPLYITSLLNNSPNSNFILFRVRKNRMSEVHKCLNLMMDKRLMDGRYESSLRSLGLRLNLFPMVDSPYM